MATAAWIGGLAATLSVVSFTPQAWKIIKDRHTEGLSVAACSLTCAGFVLWTCYGLLRGDPAIIVPNAICLLLSGFILALVLLPAHKTASIAEAIEPPTDD
ncbi:SemiSWEET family sugar transporter [Sandarakinorhabdus oryzae]|uniref:SemiSWEET family sugar transporter n=1 Tax=Sandarakinorhabdus oryzae TaxID=2675220 RepID=UPI0012E1D8CC|nr:SemiSWEET family transporter [Sandarakinorhabdus oryzae]